jgi:hypothetical protein
MAPFPTPARAPAPAARSWLPTFAVVALGAVAALAIACEDDPDTPFYLGAAGSISAAGNGPNGPYGPPYIPSGGTGASAGTGGSGFGGAPSLAAAIECVAPSQTDAPALLAVGSLSFGAGVLRASFAGTGYEITPQSACPAATTGGAAGASGSAGASNAGASGSTGAGNAGASGSAGAGNAGASGSAGAGNAGASGSAGAGNGGAGGTGGESGESGASGSGGTSGSGGNGGSASGSGGASGFGIGSNLPSPVYAWSSLDNGNRVVVTDQQLLLLSPTSEAPLAACDLPAVTGDVGTSLGRRRAAFDPADSLHVWISDGGAELYERRLVDDELEGPRCDTAASVTLTFDQPTLVRDVAARGEAGRLWLAVIAAGSDGQLTPQVRGARVEGGKLVAETPPPATPGPCSAGGLSAADAVATLPDGGVAVADGACGAVIVFGETLERPLARITLPAGVAPRALATDAQGLLFIASATEQQPGSQIGLWQAALPAASAPAPLRRGEPGGPRRRLLSQAGPNFARGADSSQAAPARSPA